MVDPFLGIVSSVLGAALFTGILVGSYIIFFLGPLWCRGCAVVSLQSVILVSFLEECNSLITLDSNHNRLVVLLVTIPVTFTSTRRALQP